MTPTSIATLVKVRTTLTLPTAIQVEENGPWSSVVYVKTKAIAPGQPTLNLVEGDTSTGVGKWTRGVSSITVRWAAPVKVTGGNPGDGGSPITSYQLQVKATTDIGSDGFVDNDAIISNLPAKRLEYTHIGLKSNTTYFYRIRAINDADGDGRPGEDPMDTHTPATNVLERGPWSEPSQAAMTTESEEGTPGQLTVTLSVNQGTGTVKVSWVVLTDQGDTPVTGYIVEYQKGDATTDFSDATSVTISSPNTLEWDHENAEGGDPAVSWAYRVRAVNGQGEGDWSETDVETVNARAPNAPELNATAQSSTEILLEWNEPTKNGSTITSYSIQQWNNDSPGAWVTADLLGKLSTPQMAPPRPTVGASPCRLGSLAATLTTSASRRWAVPLAHGHRTPAEALTPS